jgi:hypothetical protein
LPQAALEVAVKRALLESQYPVIPPVGVLRKLATEALQGADRLPDPGEAWGIVSKAIRQYGYFRPEEGLASLPEFLRRAVHSMGGWGALCNSTEPEIVRAQFRMAYESLAQREHRELLLPAPLKGELAKIGPMPEEPKRTIETQRRLLRVMAEPETGVKAEGEQTVA